MKAFITNLFLAVVWFMLGDLNLWRFFTGFLIGFFTLSLFPNLNGNKLYIKKTIGFVRFVLKFCFEMIKANFNVAKIILFKPKNTIQPFFVSYDVSQLHKAEVLILNQCITLTPGTITVLLTEDHQSLLIHVLSSTSPEDIVQSIKHNLEVPLLRFTRGLL